MNKEFYFNEFNNLNDIKLLSENINLDNTDTFKCGKYLNNSVIYNKQFLINTSGIKDTFLYFHKNNILVKYNDQYLVKALNISFIADKKNIFEFSNEFRKRIKYENDDLVYDKKLEEQIYIDLYNQFIENVPAPITHNDNVCVICNLKEYWQLNDKNKEESFYVLKYVVQHPMLEMLNEYDNSIDLHNNIACRLCKSLSKLFKITVYPSYIEYNIGFAYANNDILIAKQITDNLFKISNKIQKQCTR